MVKRGVVRVVDDGDRKTIRLKKDQESGLGQYMGTRIPHEHNEQSPTPKPGKQPNLDVCHAPGEPSRGQLS